MVDEHINKHIESLPGGDANASIVSAKDDKDQDQSFRIFKCIYVEIYITSTKITDQVIASLKLDEGKKPEETPKTDESTK